MSQAATPKITIKGLLTWNPTPFKLPAATLSLERPVEPNVHHNAEPEGVAFVVTDSQPRATQNGGDISTPPSHYEAGTSTAGHHTLQSDLPSHCPDINSIPAPLVCNEEIIHTTNIPKSFLAASDRASLEKNLDHIVLELQASSPKLL